MEIQIPCGGDSGTRHLEAAWRQEDSKKVSKNRLRYFHLTRETAASSIFTPYRATNTPWKIGFSVSPSARHFQAQQQHQPEANSGWFFLAEMRNGMKVSQLTSGEI